ncbi:hypothetical protein [Anaerobiospirillum succiniciproducens]|uniref:hypothetical protein n=1 Tax=Anaerobiospirillum succiniciproducens TaxID=13335 RepID=UPI00041C3B10|nr:hypothetical protein [Anaerobiospirillum succiniciproducens]
MIERAITRNDIYLLGIKSLTMFLVISMFSIYEDYTQDIFLMVSLLPLLILCLLDASTCSNSAYAPPALIMCEH